ncbi:MAG: hypothetical protein QE267_04085 [Akkermansiaceae bacterium]|jgi:hypothetical protein|nr:hypothetical protein [Akkermansiaceae bacterium]
MGGVMQNRITAQLLEADRKAVLDAFTTILTKLPFLVDLTPDDRRELPKMGDKSVAFVRKSVEMAQEGADYLPGAFDAAEFKSDMALYDALIPFLQKATKLQELLDDTLVLIGSDLYVAALDHYAAAKRSGDTGGLDGLMGELGKRFTRRAPTAVIPPAR